MSEHLTEEVVQNVLKDESEMLNTAPYAIHQKDHQPGNGEKSCSRLTSVVRCISAYRVDEA